MMPTDQPAKGQKAGGVAALVIKILYLVLHVLMLVFWIVFLAGIARSQSVCTDQLKYSDTPVDWASGARKLLASRNENCGNWLSLFWWTCFFQLTCIILAIMCSTMQLLRNLLLRTTITFFGIVIAVLTVQAYLPLHTNYVLDQSSGVASNLEDAVKTTSAGCVGLLVVDFLWVILATISDGAHPPAFPTCGSCGSRGSNSGAAAGQHVHGGATVVQMMQTPDGKTVMVHSPQQSGAFPPGGFAGQLPPGMMYGPPPPGAVVVQPPYGDMPANAMPVQHNGQQ